jgi:hypothetical protein
VYGGEENAGAVYIELYNRSAAPVNVTGWSGFLAGPGTVSLGAGLSNSGTRSYRRVALRAPRKNLMNSAREAGRSKHHVSAP